MTLTVSISQFRQNIADYLSKAKEGHTIILEDEKKGQQVVQVVGKKSFNSKTFEKALIDVVGIFTEKNHPEWKTKNNVIKWVSRGRKKGDRNF